MHLLLAIKAVVLDAGARPCLAAIQAGETRMDDHHLGPRFPRCVTPSLSLGLQQHLWRKVERGGGGGVEITAFFLTCCFAKTRLNRQPGLQFPHLCYGGDSPCGRRGQLQPGRLQFSLFTLVCRSNITSMTRHAFRICNFLKERVTTMFSLPHAERNYTDAAQPCCGPTLTLGPTRASRNCCV